MPMGTELDNSSFIAEIRGMREDFRRVSEQLGALTAEVKHLAHSQEQTLGFGERIRSLETEVINIKAALQSEEDARLSSERSASTERRWVISLLVPTMLGLLLAVWQTLQKGHP